MKTATTNKLTIIRDPQIEPFFISKDQHGYTVNFSKSDGGDKIKKEYTKVIGHYSTFGLALLKISKELTDLTPQYNSVSEYLKTFIEIEKRINKLIETNI